jgi:hypothetical protein
VAELRALLRAAEQRANNAERRLAGLKGDGEAGLEPDGEAGPKVDGEAGLNQDGEADLNANGASGHEEDEKASLKQDVEASPKQDAEVSQKLNMEANLKQDMKARLKLDAEASLKQDMEDADNAEDAGPSALPDGAPRPRRGSRPSKPSHSQLRAELAHQEGRMGEMEAEIRLLREMVKARETDVRIKEGEISRLKRDVSARAKPL